jgi:metal-sulfur cluster biosynthetic enzyme
MAAATASVTARWDAMRRVIDPCSAGQGVPTNLIDMGMVKEIRAEDDGMVVELRLTHPICFQATAIVDQIDAVMAELADGLQTRIEIDYAAEWWPEMMSANARERLAAKRPRTQLRAAAR